MDDVALDAFFELQHELAAGKTAPPPTASGNVPAWLAQMSDANRRQYFVDHPRSKYRKLQVQAHMNAAPPAHHKLLNRFVNKLTGRGGSLTAQVNKKVQPQHIPPAKQSKIAALLRRAFALSAQSKTAKSRGKKRGLPDAAEKQADRAGMRAVAVTLASVGLLVVGGAGLAAAGVPVGCFTPSLMKRVYKRIRPAKDDNALIHQLCSGIRNRCAATFNRDELHDSLIHQHSASKRAVPAKGPTIGGKLTGDQPDNPAPGTIGLGSPFRPFPKHNPIPPSGKV